MSERSEEEVCTLLDLDNAFYRYAKNRTLEEYRKFLYVFFMCFNCEVKVYVPCSVREDGEACAGIVKTSGGNFYVAFTSKEQADLCRGENIGFARLDSMVLMAIDDAGVEGICINPYSDKPCFVETEDMIQIMANSLAD